MRARPYRSADRKALDALLQARSDADGREALSEHKALRLGRTPHAWVVGARDSIAAYVHAGWHPQPPSIGPGHWALEAVVDPGLDPATAELEAVLDAVLHAIPASDRVTFWGWRVDEVRLAFEADWPQIRALHQMCRPLPMQQADGLPGEFEIRCFRPGVDESAWLAANNAAFADHPENGALDAQNLATRMAQAWFDSEGFLLAWRRGEIGGFCWTKLHPGAVGEIYIIGVVPAAQGLGLGKALVHAGLDDLGGRQGAREAMLYVAEEDERATSLYRTLGFEVCFTMREFQVR